MKPPKSPTTEPTRGSRFGHLMFDTPHLTDDDSVIARRMAEVYAARRASRRYMLVGLCVSILLAIGLGVTYIYASRIDHLVEIDLSQLDEPKQPLEMRYEQRAPDLARDLALAKQPAIVEMPTLTPIPTDVRVFQPPVAQLAGTSRPMGPSAGASGGPGGGGPVTGGELGFGTTGGTGFSPYANGPGGGGALRGGSGGGGMASGLGGDSPFEGPDLTSETTVRNTRRQSGSARLDDNGLDLSAFDNGQYSALIQQNPADKKDIRGFLRLSPLRFRGMRPDELGEEAWNVVPQALPSVVAYIQKSTKLRAELTRPVSLGDPEMLHYPFFFMQGAEGGLKFTAQEAEMLGKYLRAGGFLFIDDGFFNADESAFNRLARQLVKQALGEDGVFEKLPNSHPIYSAWERFAGPPAGEDNARPHPGQLSHPIYNYLEGVFVNGRMVVLFSNKGYCKAWGNWIYNPSSRGGPIDPTRQLQFAINALVFASQQRGSMNDLALRKVAASVN